MEQKMGSGFDNNEDLLDSFDPEKFIHVVRKSLIFIALFFLISFSVAYLLFIRWSKPLYESESVLKLDFESEAQNLGLATNMDAMELSELSGEMEILKSTLFFSRVAEVVDLNVSYYYYGNMLEDERYGNSPFVVSYKIKNPSFYDKSIDLVIRDSQNFDLIYTHDGTEIVSNHVFGEEIQTQHFNFLIEKTKLFSQESKGRYYFRINSQQALIDYLQENVDVRIENPNAKTIRISIEDYNKYKARDLVQAIDTLYLEFTKSAKNQALEQKINFLEGQITATEDKLEEFENYFESFTIQNRTTNLQNDIAETIAQLDALDSQRFNLRMKLSDAELLSNQLSGESEVVLSQALLSNLPKEIHEVLMKYQTLQNERSQKLGSYNQNTYIIRRLDNEMLLVRKDLLSLVDEYVAALESRIDRLQSRRSTLEGSFVELPSMGTEYNKNRRFYQLQEDFLLSLRKSKMELEITRAGTVTKFVILSPASLPQAPIKPEVLMIYGVAFSFALVVSFVFLLVRYLLNNKITSIKELDRLINVPILGVVPRYRRGKMLQTRLVIKPSSKSALSESLRSIRTNMEFMNGTKDSHIITVTSTVSGEGKTFIAVNLGAIIAFSNQKVCIVDLDMRKPKVHLAFGDEASVNGVSTHLIGKNTLDECIRKSDIENLDYVPAGPNPPNPSELILHKEYEIMLKELSERYDMVILDTPPVGLVTDAVLSMRHSDLQLYVLRADYSKRSFVKSIENLRKTDQFPNLTAIFNSVKSSSGGYGHGYGYGYGYGYYEETDKS